MVDAAYYRKDINQTYFFGGTRYARIKFTPGTAEEQITVGPTKITKNWGLLKKAGFGTVDAILPHPSAENEAYFFSGSQYIRAKVLDDTIVYGPSKTTDVWKCFGEAGFDTIDAAFLVPGSPAEAYVFRGVKYIRINIWDDKIIYGPSNIREVWPGLGEAGFDTVDAALAVPGKDDGETYFFKGDRYVKARVVAGSSDKITWGPYPIEDYWKTLDWI